MVDHQRLGRAIDACAGGFVALGLASGIGSPATLIGGMVLCAAGVGALTVTGVVISAREDARAARREAAVARQALADTVQGPIIVAEDMPSNDTLIVALRRAGGSLPSQEHLMYAAGWKSKGYVSKRLAELERRGFVVRRRDGRKKRIALSETH